MNPAIRIILLTLGLAAQAASAGAPFWPTWSDLGISGSQVIAAGSDPDIVLSLAVPPQRSIDGGKTFAALPGFDSVHHLDQLLSGPSGVMYLVGDSPQTPRLYRSDDSGATWRLTPAQLIPPDLPAGRWIDPVAVGPDAEVIYGTQVAGAPSCSPFFGCSSSAEAAFVSKDAGLTWRPLGGAGLTGTVRALSVASNGRVLVATTGDGLFRSADSAATWLRLPSSKPGTITVDNVDPMTMYALAPYTMVLWMTEDGGVTWRQAPVVYVQGDAGAQVLADPLVAGRVFLVHDEGRVYESVDRARTWTRVANAARPFSALDPRAISISAGGDSRFILAGAKRLETRTGSYALGSDFWWNPAESGRGLSITQHDNGQTFVAWYAYDTAGNQVWRVLPNGSWQDGKTLSGALYETRGPKYFGAAFDPGAVSVLSAGSATLHFDTDSNATLTYQLNEGTHGTIPITRELFGQPVSMGGPCDVLYGHDFSDVWWDANESGWGLAVSIQNYQFFAAWYAYLDNGQPLWITMPLEIAGWSGLCPPGATPEYFGNIYATQGPPSTGPFDPSKVIGRVVGKATLAFGSDNSLYMSYTVNGVTVSRTLTRQPF